MMKNLFFVIMLSIILFYGFSSKFQLLEVKLLPLKITHTKDKFLSGSTLQIEANRRSSNHYRIFECLNDTLTKEYITNLTASLIKINQGLTLAPKEVEKTIPSTYKEFLYFFNLYANKESKAISTIEKLQFKYASQHKIALNKFFYMLRYYNGELIPYFDSKYGEKYSNIYKDHSFEILDSFSSWLYEDNYIKKQFCKYLSKLPLQEKILYSSLCYEYANIEKLCN